MGNRSVSRIRELLRFVGPYQREAILALLMLGGMVVMDLAIPRLIQRIVDRGIAGNDRAVVVQTALLMLGISALSTVVAIANNGFSVRVGEGVARDLREALFLKIQQFSFGDLDRQKTGDLLVRLTSDVAAVKMLTQVSLRIGTRAPLLMIGSLALMIATSRPLALAMLPLLIVTGLLIVLFVARTEPLFRRVQERRDVLNGVLQENVAGARLVKAFVRADYEEERFEGANEAMTVRGIQTMRVLSAMTPALTLCINAGIVIVIWVGGKRSIEGELSLGELVAFTNYLFTTMTPLVMMTMLSSTWASGLASLRRMDAILTSVPEIVDAENAKELPSHTPLSLAFDDVSFRYHARPFSQALPGSLSVVESKVDEGASVLRGISFAAKPGETIAILGSTGAGKSTLANLIPRFYDVESGSVCLGFSPSPARQGGEATRYDVRECTQRSLAAQVGFVPQEALLFAGTIRDNIRYGRPTASDAEVRQAAEAAQAVSFIEALPEGYESRVAPRGANFSGGQKQRLAIARALLVDPEILILDDSTSAVDGETEARIQAALADRRAGSARPRITVLIAQRISTVLDADTILVLEKGAIVARGNHATLLETSPIYQEIYASQLGIPGEPIGGPEPQEGAARSEAP